MVYIVLVVRFIKRCRILIYMKCEICKNKIHEIFLAKPVGTYVKDEKGKKHMVCNECQSKLGSKDKILEKL